MGFISKFKSIICNLFSPKTSYSKSIIIRRPLSYKKIIKSVIKSIKYVVPNIQSSFIINRCTTNTKSKSSVKALNHHKYLQKLKVCRSTQRITESNRSSSTQRYRYRLHNSISKLLISKLVINDKYIKKK
jgi:hypothetical protein